MELKEAHPTLQTKLRYRTTVCTRPILQPIELIGGPTTLRRFTVSDKPSNNLDTDRSTLCAVRHTQQKTNVSNQHELDALALSLSPTLGDVWEGYSSSQGNAESMNHWKSRTGPPKCDLISTKPRKSIDAGSFQIWFQTNRASWCAFGAAQI